VVLNEFIDLPRPRARGNPGFAALEDRILLRVLQHRTFPVNTSGTREIKQTIL
jgi:sulfonate transport system ATP-binding protein